MDIIEQLVLRLPEYISGQGIELDRSGQGLCPLHDDKATKSFGIIPRSGNKKWHCFGCKKSGDLFDLAEALEGLPSKGTEFRTVTIPTLAKRFNLKYTEKVRSPERAKISKIREIYRYVHDQMVMDQVVLDFLKDRNLSVSTAKRMGIGRIVDVDNLLRKLRHNFTKKDLEESKVIHPKLYENRILFTFFDEFGSPVGFTGRTLSDDPTVSKYVHGREHPLFIKSEYLYNYHFAKKFDTLYVVEGQMDACRLIENNMFNVVGISGTALSGKQIEMFSNHKKIILAFDGDKSGLDRMDKYYQKIPNCAPIIIPGGNDPDSYIRNYGLKAFTELEHLDDLSWRIIRADYSQPRSAAKKFLAEMMESNPIDHHTYLRKLALGSGIDYIKLKKGLEHMINVVSWTRLEKLIEQKKNIKNLNINIQIS